MADSRMKLFLACILALQATIVAVLAFLDVFAFYFAFEFVLIPMYLMLGV